MADLHDVMRLDELPSGSVVEVDVADRTLAVMNVDGEVFALDNECTHMVASLADGYLDSKCLTLECPLHGSRFDLRTGEPQQKPARIPVRTYVVVVEDDMIKVLIDG